MHAHRFLAPLLLAATACQKPPTGLAPQGAPSCQGRTGTAHVADEAELVALMQSAHVTLSRGSFGQPMAGALAVRDGTTLDLVLAPDPRTYAVSVLRGADVLFADRSNEWINDATFVVRIKLNGAFAPDGTARNLRGNALALAGAPPPGVPGPVVSSSPDPEGEGPRADFACATGVPGRIEVRVRTTLRRSYTPGENQLETHDDVYEPLDVTISAPVIERGAVEPLVPPDYGFDVLAHVDVPDDAFGTDVWGAPDGQAAYLGLRTTGDAATRGPGLAVVDLADASKPEMALVDGVGPALDVVARGTTVYVASAHTEHGLFVVDAADPRAPRVVAPVDAEHVNPSLHDLYPDGDRLYGSCMSSCDGGGVAILDATTLPTEIAYEPATFFGGTDATAVHDTVVEGGWGGVATWSAGWQIVDFTDASAPQVMHRFSHPGAQAHSILPLGRTHAATTDEYAGGHVRFWRLDEGGGATEIARYQTRRSVSAHNLWLDGTTLFVAYYHDGVRALDVSDPAQPREIGALRTFVPRPSSPKTGYLAIFAGAWGVWAGGGRVLVSDTETGLWVLRLRS